MKRIYSAAWLFVVLAGMMGHIASAESGNTKAKAKDTNEAQKTVAEKPLDTTPTKPLCQVLDGQRFWNDPAIIKHVQQQTVRLAKAGKIPPRKTIESQIKQRTTNVANVPLNQATKPAATEKEIYNRLLQSTLLVVSLTPEGKHHLGTAFAIGSDAIVTNCHVVAPQDPKEVRFVVMNSQGCVFPICEILASDGFNDLIVARIDTMGHPMKGLPLAKSLPAVGETVYQLGHTKGAFWTFTTGQVMRYCIENATHQITKKNISLPVIDISNKISGGSSGSAIVNTQGEVVGVYARRRWYYQTAKEYDIAVSVQTKDKTNKTNTKPAKRKIKDQVVLFHRHCGIPITQLRNRVKNKTTAPIKKKTPAKQSKTK